MMSSEQIGRSGLVASLRTSGKFEIREYPVLAPRRHGALVRMELAGVCGTDVHVVDGLLPTLVDGVVLGHENTGVVEVLGSELSTDLLEHPLREGDRVVFRGGSCGRCAACLVQQTPRACTKRGAAYGFAGPPDEGPHFLGGFGQYVQLWHRYTEVFRTSLPAEVAVLCEPTAVAVGAVLKAGIQIGDTVVVQGAGPIGMLVLACARLAGATQTVMIGGPDSRLQLAKNFGATEVVNIAEVRDPSERLEAVRALTPRGLGADVVFGCVGRAAALTEGLLLVKNDTGRMIELGTALGAEEITFSPPQALVGPGRTVTGQHSQRTSDWVRALRVLESGIAPFDQLVSHQLPLSRVGDAISSLRGSYELDGRPAFKVTISPWS
jgi:L-iditol 2-dehydrogenase